MVFPEQLADEPLIRVKRGSKEPVFRSSAVEPTGDVAQWVVEGNNAGICLAESSLVVVDADTAEVVSVVYEQLPETFTVSTGGEGFGLHYYFECAEWSRNATLKDGDSSIRSDGWMAVIPPSEREEQYAVANDAPVAEVGSGQLSDLVDELTEDASSSAPSVDSDSRPRPASSDLDELDTLIHHDGQRQKLRGILRDRHAPHGDRVYLAGFLYNETSLSPGDVCHIIDKFNRWENYDAEVSERQILSVIKSSGRST